MPHRFVQLSDIHFGQERAGEVVVYEDVRDELIRDAKALAEQRGVADRVLIVGDTAYSGSKGEYQTAGEWLDALAEAVGCEQTDIRVVPGNHDCDLRELVYPATAVQADIRSSAAAVANQRLAELAQSDANPLLPAIKAYREFAAAYGCDFESVAKPCWVEDLDLPHGVTLRLVGLNSVQVSDKSDAPGKMVLGSSQYILPNSQDVIWVVLMHHPLGWYLDKVEARPYLHGRAKLIMVGHEHVAEIAKTSDAAKGDRIEIFSGATTPPSSDAAFGFTYNWLEVDGALKGSDYVLTVTILPRVWVPERTCFAAATERMNGKESATLELACPTIKVGSGRASEDVEGAAPKEAGTMADQGVKDPEQGSGDRDARARLRLYFWRYLGWRERLSVLVSHGLLPATADQPLPQTLERLALDLARDESKLAELWDAVMEHVPDDKRQVNPFTGRRS